MEKSTVVGKAGNAKSGAVVVTENAVYYIDGLEEWPEELEGEQVEVTGIHQTVNHEQQSTDAVQVSEMLGRQDIIREATYRLVES